ncbi:MAG: aspartate--tRNA ligase [Alphaproteobacteria bacterium]|nr:aspartate--tRNA ligase [Alphaproteobacteria bacterium]
MTTYRTHNCAALRQSDVGKNVKLSGWIARKRDHGGILFIDLRDTFGVTQLVLDPAIKGLEEVDSWRPESVITIEGSVVERVGDTKNAKLATGDIEVKVTSAVLQSAADVLPFQIAEEDQAGEHIRLKYRYLDLRKERMQKNIRLKNGVIQSLRRRMWEQGFQEFQTPILTASSPEGARDFLVPARMHPGQFYALPQSPQQFKQLLMMAGFDRYFQIAPCFRDEDSRADRLAEHYQLDVEMSFVTQDDVFATMEPVLKGVFEEFNAHTGKPHKVSDAPFPRIAYRDAMMKYGSDKPDLRNPLTIVDVTEVFKRDDVTFNAFKGVISSGGVVRAIRAPKVSDRPRSFFDKLNDWARGEGAPGLGYITIDGAEGKGPIAKFVPPAAIAELAKAASLETGDAVFFVCDKEAAAAKMAGKARDKICDEMDIREKGVYKLCWIVDFPMYEEDEKTKEIMFSHNPFSMPQGGLDSLNNKHPLEIMAHQYDCVCNGYELCSGAIRNHKPEIMEKAFAIAGYGKEVLERKFGGMLSAMKFGAPPHGGCGFGVDRITMILADEPNLREVNAFVMNGAFEDPLMGAPGEVDEQQLKDLHIKVVKPMSVKAA